MRTLNELTILEREAHEKILKELMDLLTEHRVTVLAAFGDHPRPCLILVSLPVKWFGVIASALKSNFDHPLLYEVVGVHDALADHDPSMDIHIYLR